MSESATRECVICMSEIVEEEEVKALECNHSFHKECIDEWLIRSRHCPVCRMRQGGGGDEEAGGGRGASSSSSQSSNAIITHFIHENRPALKRSVFRQSILLVITLSSIIADLATSKSMTTYALFPHLFMSFLMVSTFCSLISAPVVEIIPVIRLYNIISSLPFLRSLCLTVYVTLNVINNKNTSNVFVVLLIIISVFASMQEDHSQIILVSSILIQSRNRLLDPSAERSDAAASAASAVAPSSDVVETVGEEEENEEAEEAEEAEGEGGVGGRDENDDGISPSNLNSQPLQIETRA